MTINIPVEPCPGMCFETEPILFSLRHLYIFLPNILIFFLFEEKHLSFKTFAVFFDKISKTGIVFILIQFLLKQNI